MTIGIYHMNYKQNVSTLTKAMLNLANTSAEGEQGYETDPT